MIPARLFFALLLAALFVSIAALWPRPSHSDNQLRRVTSTAEDGISLNPSISGDGRRVTFESTEDLANNGGANGFRAFQSELTTDSTQFLQMALSRAVAPGMSQDGSRIVFASTSDPLALNPDGNSEIFLYTGTLKQITNSMPASLITRVMDGNFQPTISDDGRFVAFSSNRDLTGQNADANLEVLVFDNDTGAFTQITNSTNEVGASNAKISGDGSHIVFVRDSGTNLNSHRDLVLQKRDAGTVQIIAENVDSVALTYGRAISDDGTRVVYSQQTATNSTQVFLFDARVGSSRQLTSLGTRASDVPLNATISGDGKRIAFATRRNVVGRNSDGSVELLVYDVPTGQLSQLTNATSAAAAEVVSSLSDDGSVAAFNFPRILSGAVANSDFANNSEIYTILIAPRASSGAATILNGASLGNEPSLSMAIAPDSIAIARGSALASMAQQPQPLNDGSFPLSVGGTSVTVNGIPAQVLYVSPEQVNFVTPRETAVGPATVVVTNSDSFQSIGSVMIVPTAPGVFTFGGDGQGEAAILNADTLVRGPFDPTDGTLRLLIFATGARNSSHVTASMGGQPVTVESVLPARELPGLDEIHVLVPASLRGNGTVDVAVQSENQSSNSATTTLSGSVLRDITINEVLADPPNGTAGDANHDGVRSPSQDEFIELVNTTARDIDLSSFELLTRASTGNNTLRHKFAASDVLSAGTSLIVFAGGNPSVDDPIFGGARVVKASTGSLSLSNAGSTVTLRDASGVILTTFSYGDSTGLAGDASQSLTRSPDSSGSFVLHQSATGSDGRPFSPGTRLDGTPFTANPAVALVQVFPGLAAVESAGQRQFTAQALDQGGHMMTDIIFNWRSSDTAIATVSQNGLATGAGVGVAQVFAAARGVASGPALLTVTAPIASPSPTPSSSPSPSASPSPTQSPTPGPPVVISEFRTRGPSGANDEFIELYNNSDSGIDVSGWKIRGSNNAANVTTRLTISSGATIPAHGHFLATNSGYSGSIPGDQTYSSGITNDGGIAVTLPNDSIVDQVGLSSGSAFKEETNLAPLPSDANQSYERKPGGATGSTQDVGNNFDDFSLITPGDPQNLNSPATPGPSPSPSASPSPNPSPSPSPTPRVSPSPNPSPSPIPTASPSPSSNPSPTPTPARSVIINELDSDQAGSDTLEFVELYDGGSGNTSLNGLVVVFYNGATDTSYAAFDLDGFTANSQGYFTIGNSGVPGVDLMFSNGTLQNGPDAVAIYRANASDFPSGTALTTANLQDAIVYDTGQADDAGLSVLLNPDEPQVDESGAGDSSAVSVQRCPNGSGGTRSTLSYALHPPTADRPNVCPTPSPSPSPSPSPGPSPSPSPIPSPSPSGSPSPSPSPGPSPSPSPTPTPVRKVVISQVYGGGGNANAPFANDFIEIFNAGNEAVNLSGWSVQYAGATSTNWSPTSLTAVSLLPGHYYLIQEASGGGVGAGLPSPDVAGATSMAAGAGKVALVNSNIALSGNGCPFSATVVDFIGYGTTADCFEGAGRAPSPSNTTADNRVASGCTDTDNNSTNFTAGNPTPRNTVSTPNQCPGALGAPSDLARTASRWREVLSLAILRLLGFV